jgi:hypothetical protein
MTCTYDQAATLRYRNRLVKGHQDLPAGGHEDDAMVITECNQIP